MRQSIGRLGGLILVASLLLVGCAQHIPRSDTVGATSSEWSGRLSLRIQSDPPQQLASHFELDGSAQTGTLVLTTTLGNTLARLQWAPGSATLVRQGESKRFNSLAELTFELTGATLPIESLFSWLRGEESTAPGWSVDLSQIAQGRLNASQLPPAVPTQLRIVLETRGEPR